MSNTSQVSQGLLKLASDIKNNPSVISNNIKGKELMKIAVEQRINILMRVFKR